jgi:hypothetical protein
MPAFSRVFEKVIYQRLFDHLNNNATLNEHQYGFRSKVSTKSASFVLLNEILAALNNKLMVGGIFCDFLKAFNSINHALLLDKLNFYGVLGSLQSSKITLRSKISKGNFRS